jgi:hypothetical protein
MKLMSRAMGFWTYQTSQERSASIAKPTGGKLISSSFQSILLKNSKDQVNKLEQELNFGKLEGPVRVQADKQYEEN